MKKKKKLKGMTLVEIIISMAVFAMLGVILLRVGCLIDSTTKASSRLNKRVNEQSPYAAAQVTHYIEYDEDGNAVVNELDSKPVEINVSVSDEHGNLRSVTIDGSKYDAEVTINANRYSTKKTVVNNASIYDPNGPNSEHDLKFVQLDNTIHLNNVVLDDTKTSYDIPDSEKAYSFPEMEWVSSADGIATVNKKGVITRVSVGQCEIYGTTSTGVTYQVSVEVK